MSDFWKGFKLMKPEDNEVFCIAYGSNLDETRMKKRCPSAEVFGTSVIGGYRLLFKQSMTGAYATIEQDANLAFEVMLEGATFAYDGAPHALPTNATATASSGVTLIEYSKDREMA